MTASLSLIVAASLAVLAGVAGASDDGKADKFIVTFSIFPDPLHYFSFYNMPRTTKEAEKSHFSLAMNNTDSDWTTVYCRKGDYRVCVLFDLLGTVAGIQISAAVDEIKKANLPQDLDNDEYWIKQTVLGKEVYSTVAYFVGNDTLAKGGRAMDADFLTAPNGIFIRTNRNGQLNVSLEQQHAEETGFMKQACFRGMGNHYFQGLTPTSKCEENKPYFLLFNPQTEKLHGFGITQFGKVSQGRGFLSGWFETPPALVVGMIAPNSPPCLKQFVKKYGIFTMHVYFVDKPWSVRC